MRRVVQITLAVAVIAGTGCGNDVSGSDRDAGAAGSGAGPTDKEKLARLTKSRRSLTIKAGDSQYGSVLFSKGNRAIYYFERESTRTPKCYGACAQAWPSALTRGRPQAGAGVKPGLLGRTRRANGKTQATYKGHPLYYYVNDPRGAVGCHNVEEFGGLWVAVKPSGDPVG
jgi:predicted lipoprotein with Yx(FWY)xxD motif